MAGDDRNGKVLGEILRDGSWWVFNIRFGREWNWRGVRNQDEASQEKNTKSNRNSQRILLIFKNSKGGQCEIEIFYSRIE